MAITQRDNLDALLAEACRGVEGIDAATFRALLSPEDAKDVEGGHIPAHTLKAYARSFSEGRIMDIMVSIIRDLMVAWRGF